MAQQVIVTTPTNSGLGTPINEAFNDCNSNFSELYARVQTSPPATLVGSPGDEPGMYAYSSNYFYYCFAAYDGSTVIWAQISEIGNVAVTQMVYGNTSVEIPSSNGNVQISVGGVSNVAVFDNTGNLTLSNSLNSTQVSTSGNVTAGNVISNTITSNTISVAATISAVGNISSNYFIGNGRNLTGIVAEYGNLQVAAYLPTYSGNLYNVNIFTDGYYYSNGAPFSGSGGGGSSYTDANVAAYLPTYAGNLGGTLTTGTQSYITSLGTLTGLTVNGLNAVSITPTAQPVTIAPTFGGAITLNSDGVGSINNMVIGNSHAESATFTDVTVTGNITGGNLLSGSAVSASGNVTGQYLFGDGTYITNIGTGSNYSNANVAAYLPTYTGNISGGNISVLSNQTIGGHLSVSGNANVSGNVNVTDTVSTNQVIGQLTGTVNGINPTYGIWDFGSISGTTFDSPIAWIFAQTSAGNVDMGTIASPSSNNIDIGTIY